jgi:hypothetical protein
MSFAENVCHSTATEFPINMCILGPLPPGCREVAHLETWSPINCLLESYFQYL